jgi:protein ImuB
MLADLPEKELISRMGQDGKRLRQIARGELPHLFRPVEVPFTLEEQRDLDFPLDDLESLLFGMALMLDQLVLRAKARMVALASVSIELTLDGGGRHSVTVQPALPTNDKHLWLKLLHHKLDACPPPASILAVALHAEPGIIGEVQLGLFSPQLPEPGRLDLTLARISAIVGEGNVGRAVLEDTNALEGFRMESFQVPSSDSDMAVPAMPRASLRLLCPCERARVTLRNTQPSVFFFREQQYTVERAYGPWWDSGDWWNSNLWGFEQWDLVARGPDGTLLCCCLMRDLMQNEWQIAALYD